LKRDPKPIKNAPNNKEKALLIFGQKEVAFGLIKGGITLGKFSDGVNTGPSFKDQISRVDCEITNGAIKLKSSKSQSSFIQSLIGCQYSRCTTTTPSDE